MKGRKLALVVLLAGTAACADRAGTEPEVERQYAKPGSVTMVEDVAGTVAGEAFTGTVRITEFALQDGQLVVSGVLNGVTTVGTTTTQVANETFTTSAELVSPSQVCDILFLDLGPISLDLLGLTVDLSQIVLDINAVPGPGNLLGNLLCAVVNLLNIGNLGGLLNVLDVINNLLG